MQPQNTLDILKHLIAFDTTSRNSNLELIRYVESFLKALGIEPVIIPDKSGTKANLFATLGPANTPGVMLSGHTDVVPIDGQNWSVPAFELSLKNARAYGRGSADMKGFIACALNAFAAARTQNLVTPLHLALSFDEEIGCIGVHSLLHMLEAAPTKPLMCIVGEPTSLKVATGHKGKIAIQANCTGSAGHSALAPNALNAIHLAVEFVQRVRKLQLQVEQTHFHDEDYGIPYTTLHVGKITGGIALNIVPDNCRVDFEIRNIAQDDIDELMEELKRQADEIVAPHLDEHPAASIQFEELFSYPGLLTPEDDAVVDFVKSLTGENDTIKVAFGTEAGLFNKNLSIPSVVCGPGSMDQGHKPDEYVDLEQLDKCDRMLEKLLSHLSKGL